MLKARDPVVVVDLISQFSPGEWTSSVSFERSALTVDVCCRPYGSGGEKNVQLTFEDVVCFTVTQIPGAVLRNRSNDLGLILADAARDFWRWVGSSVRRLRKAKQTDSNDAVSVSNVIEYRNSDDAKAWRTARPWQQKPTRYFEFFVADEGKLFCVLAAECNDAVP